MVDGQKQASVETTGASVTEAIAEGLALLGLELDDVDVEVLAEPTRGLFGLGSHDAQVRVSVKPPVDEAASPEEPAVAPPETPVATAPTAARRPRRAKAAREQPRPAPAPKPEPEPVVAPAPTSGAPGGLEETAHAVVDELMGLMGYEDARITVREAETADDEPERDAPLLIDIKARGDALIGRHGETLTALQYITRLIIGRERAGRRRILLDVNGYKVRREEKLRGLAQRLAQQAVDTDRTVVLEPMPPFERRIIHIALRDHPEVTTQSIGEGDHRKVTIIPKFE
jgi:spoIIIJ-associated protein